MKILAAVLLLLSGCVAPEVRVVPLADWHDTTLRLEYASKDICSGTAVGPDKVLTAAHCMRGDVLQLVNGTFVTVTDVKPTGRDSVLLTIAGVRFKKWSRLGTPQQGQRVRWVGNPLGEPDVYREGYVAKVADDSIVVVGAVCKGDSGAGIRDDLGRVVAVVSAITNSYGCTFGLASR